MKRKIEFRAYNSKGVDKNRAKCNMGFGRMSKIFREMFFRVHHLSTRPRCRCACHLGGRTVQSPSLESWCCLWRDDLELRPDQQEVEVLGTPVGQPEFVVTVAHVRCHESQFLVANSSA